MASRAIRVTHSFASHLNHSHGPATIETRPVELTIHTANPQFGQRIASLSVQSSSEVMMNGLVVTHFDCGLIQIG